jgi:hypothetical protein
MTTYKFGGMLYPTSRAMHMAIAETWLSADGHNSREDMFESLAQCTDEALAAEVVDAWNVLENDAFDLSELVDAFAALRRDFDEHFPK